MGKERENDQYHVPENPQQAEALIRQYLKRGWDIQRFDLAKSDISFGIVAPSGSYFRLEGIFLDDGSEIDYKLMNEERKQEWNQASHILELMWKTPSYLGIEILLSEF